MLPLLLLSLQKRVGKEKFLKKCEAAKIFTFPYRNLTQFPLAESTTIRFGACVEAANITEQFIPKKKYDLVLPLSHLDGSLDQTLMIFNA